jgi:hypothetical protein
MRVKVGDEWHQATPETPIMVELTHPDRLNIAAMHPSATRYAVFDDRSGLTREAKLAWMDRGRVDG